MHCARNQFLPGAAFSRDQYRRPRIFEPRNHSHHVLNFRGRSCDSIKLRLGIDALTQELVFVNQPNLLRHPL